ncbi:MAG: excisionase family DNA binding protein [Candidatus Latescibacterota bacterium]|jgi:excisionase family DNA binding protein
MEPLLLTPEEAAKMLRISKSYLYELKSRNRIPYIKVGASLRFRPQDLQSFVEKLAIESRREQERQRIAP